MKKIPNPLIRTFIENLNSNNQIYKSNERGLISLELLLQHLTSALEGTNLIDLDNIGDVYVNIETKFVKEASKLFIDITKKELENYVLTPLDYSKF